MSKNSEAVYKSYSALAADSVKGGVESCWCALGVTKYLEGGEYGS